MNLKDLLVLLLLVGSMFAFSASAQSTDQDWRRVEALKNRTNIIIETKIGNTLKGKVLSVNASSLSFRSGGHSVTLGRDDVFRVYLTRKKSMLKRALWGAAAGAGIGTAISVGVTVATKGDPLAAAGGFIFGIPAGAVIGVLTTGRKRGQLIYNSQ